jgi:exopolysaccharide biosynthesis polyprenyl glycosylphosphotransferase
VAKDSGRSLFSLQLVFDIFSMVASWALTYQIRFNILPGGDSGLFPLFAWLTPLVVALGIYNYNSQQLYASNLHRPWHSILSSLFIAHTRTLFAMVVIFYFLFPGRISRLGLAMYFVISILVAIIIRLIVINAHYMRMRKKYPLRVLLIGFGDRIEEYLKRVNSSPAASVEFVGHYNPGRQEKYGIPLIISATLDEAVAVTRPDLVVMSYPDSATRIYQEILAECYDLLVPLSILLPNDSMTYLRSTLGSFRGLPIMQINHHPQTWIDRLLKRGIDIFGAIVGLLLFSVFFLILPILVKLTSKGPVFYGQKRMTRDGKLFTMWKFRSMRIDAETSSGAVWAQKDDPRRTPIGKFLRESSLDEIPQFWNVLRGDMSLVGPRPERPELIEQFKDEIPGYMLRHKMRAGLTGWAQINGWRGNTSLDKRIEYDLYYIKNWSFLNDIKIILLTPFKGFISPNAY